MLARMLAAATAFIFIAAAAPAVYSAQSDTGGIKGKAMVKSAPAGTSKKKPSFRSFRPGRPQYGN